MGFSSAPAAGPDLVASAGGSDYTRPRAAGQPATCVPELGAYAGHPFRTRFEKRLRSLRPHGEAVMSRPGQLEIREATPDDAAGIVAILNPIIETGMYTV